MQQRNNNEIGFDELRTFLVRYKWLIITSVLIATIIAIITAYILPNIYQANSSIEIVSSREGVRHDIMGRVTQATDENIVNEKEIIQSRYIIFKALENLNIGTRYFVTKHFKTKELYKSSPFIVKSGLIAEQVEGYLFQIIPVGEKNFRLIVEPPLQKKLISKVRSYIEPLPEKKQPVYYDMIHEFAEPINTPWFNITVQKIYKLENKHYSFTITPNEKMFKFIQKKLTVSNVSEKGTILTLTFEDTVPLRAKEILDAIGYTYVSEKLSLKTKSAQSKLNFIDSQLKAINTTLESSANKLQTFKASNIIINIGDKTSVTTQKLSELEAQLYKLQMSKSVLENIHNYIETHNDIRGIDVSFKDEQYSNNTVDAIIIKIQDAHARRISMLEKHTKLHPSVINITKELISLRRSLKESIESSLRSTNRRLSTLNGIIKKKKNELRSLPEQEKQLASLTRDFMVNEKIYAYLLEKRAETAIVESSAISNTRMINIALVPELPSRPKRILIIISGFILGIIIGILLAAARSFFNNTIKTTNDIESLTTLPIYGILPALKEKVLKLEVLKDPKSPFAESYRSLRTNLQFAQKENQANIILVTSTIAGEGKSTTVANLGAIFQMANYRSIVINLDLRKPTLHHYFNVDNSSGMSTYLSGKNSIGEIIQSTQYKNLDIIASGPIPPNPSELILNDKLNRLLDDLREVYDYIFIDSSPLGLVADTIHLMQYADISLIIFREGYAKRSFVTDLNNLVRKHNLKHIGLVINSADISSGYGYGYGY